jgi:hypothetical protein
MLYGLSGVVGLVAARAGGTGAWRDTRAAVFWSALLAAPVGLVATLLAAILPQVQGGSGIILGMLAPVAFATALSLCLAEAHGFRSASRVFVCVGFVASGVVAAVWLAGTL